MLIYLIIIAVCFGASIVGAICGIGGGVIIKPVLDATGIMPITTVSFLSGCTVFSMSFVSLFKSRRNRVENKFDRLFACTIALGGIIGGIIGKEIYEFALHKLPDTDKVGAIQAFALLIITFGTLIFTLKKSSISCKKIGNKLVVFGIGVMLGIMSAFLGIGGGPINIVVLFYFFSMEAKEAAQYSLFVILCSQTSSILSTIIQKNIPVFDVKNLLLMIICGILGGIVGSKIAQKISNNHVEHLFIGIMSVIIGINVWNIYQYM